MPQEPKFVFHVAREFISAASEYYYSPNSHNYGRLRGKFLQLNLVDLSIRAQDEASYAMDEVDLMRNGQTPISAEGFESFLSAFATHVNIELGEASK